MSEPVNLGGRPCEFSQKDHDAIVEAFKHTIVLNNVAGQVRRSKPTIRSWLKQGQDDVEQELDTPFARFFTDVKESISATVRALEERLLNGDETRWQRFAWYLERCAREDYGADGGIIEEIKQEFELIKKDRESKNGA